LPVGAHARSSSYGSALAFQLEDFPVHVRFFHLRADGAGMARATFVLTVEDGELKTRRMP